MSNWQKIITEGIVQDGNTFQGLLKKGDGVTGLTMPTQAGEKLALTFTWDGSNSAPQWETIDASTFGSGTVTDVTASDNYLSSATSDGGITWDVTLDTNSIDEAALKATNSATDNYLLSYDNGSGGFTWVDPATAGASLPGGSDTNIMYNNGGTWEGSTLANAGIQAKDAALTALSGLTISGEDGLVVMEDGGGSTTTIGVSSAMQSFLGGEPDASAVGAQESGNYAVTDAVTNLFAGSTIDNVAIADQNWVGTQIPTVPTLLDENDMNSNSETATASQQSIKAYVDNTTSTAVNGLATAASVAGVAGTTSETFSIDNDSTAAQYTVKAEATKLSFLAGGPNSTTGAYVEAGDLNLTNSTGVTWDGTATVGNQYVEVNDGYNFTDYTALSNLVAGFKVQRDSDAAANNMVEPKFAWHDNSDQLEGGGTATGLGGEWKCTLIHNDGNSSAEDSYEAPIALKILGSELVGTPADPDSIDSTEAGLKNVGLGTMFVGSGGGLYIKTS